MSDPLAGLRQPVPEILARVLRERILDGRIRPDEPLREAALAAEFEVSRNTVREALIRLGHEGLVSTRAHRGSRVAMPDHETVVEIMALRQVVEPGAVRLLVRARPDLSAAWSLVEAMEAAAAEEDWLRYGHLDLDFHSTLVSAAGSRRLSELFARTVRELRLHLLVIDTSGGGSVSRAHVAEHRALLDAVGSGDAARALAIIDRHLADAELALFGPPDTEG